MTKCLYGVVIILVCFAVHHIKSKSSKSSTLKIRKMAASIFTSFCNPIDVEVVDVNTNQYMYMVLSNVCTFNHHDTDRICYRVKLTDNLGHIITCIVNGCYIRSEESPRHTFNIRAFDWSKFKDENHFGNNGHSKQLRHTTLLGV